MSIDQSNKACRSAYAKLNLFLYIIGRRRDSYHCLESLMVKLSLADLVMIANRADGVFSCSVIYADDSMMRIKGENIVLRAAKHLKFVTGITYGADISIYKRIPIASGLAGGSADVAAVLHCLADLWGLQLSMQDMVQIGLSIGTDVVFCLQELPCFVYGTGDKMIPMHLDQKLELVLVNNRQAIYAADVYKRSVTKFSTTLLDKGVDSQTVIGKIIHGSNDLEEPAFAMYPDLYYLINALKAESGCIAARMSGSGATCFGIFTSKEEADSAYSNIKNTIPKWWVYRDVIYI